MNRVQRWGRPIALGLTTPLLVLASAVAAVRWQAVTEQGLVGVDLAFYRAAAQRFLDTGSQYLPYQLVGHYESQPLVAPELIPSLYPPPALGLFLPFLWLPAFLWWAIPLGVTVWALRDARPSAWTWPLLAVILAWPGTTTMVMVGNTTMWGVAAVAAGLRWGWPAALLVVKPTLLPFAFVSVQRRSFWLTLAVVLAASLPLLAEWQRWIVALANSTAGVGYSLGSYPAMLLPVVAQLSGRRHDT